MTIPGVFERKVGEMHSLGSVTEQVPVSKDHSVRAVLMLDTKDSFQITSYNYLNNLEVPILYIIYGRAPKQIITH